MNAMNVRTGWVPLVLLLAAACAPKHIEEYPIYTIGDELQGSDVWVAMAAADAADERRTSQAKRDSIAGAAMVGCAPAVCEAVSRGELMIGMTEVQVMATTRTTGAAWTARRSAAGVVLVPRLADDPPHDAVAGVTMVQIRNGLVASYTYREAHGLRVVNARADTSAGARGVAVADALIREADGLVAAGQLDAALDRYDRASVLKPRDALLEYRIASLLDQQLRPAEALMRYQRFLHQMELEKIDAVGDANAKLGEAIAHARERVVVLKRR